MSVREIFYKVEKHLLKQNEKSMDTDVFGCMYRSNGGLSCAVGCLMTDDIYRPSFEGESVRDSSIMEALTPIVGVNEDKRVLKLYLLRELQVVHDESQPTCWASNLAKIKHDFDIS
tara:strand:+ start:514 stop:861 length:348 start_codon:yes stop_codon:yes gene_type:complete